MHRKTNLSHIESGAAGSINSVPNIIIHGKTKPRSFISRNAEAKSIASYVPLRTDICEDSWSNASTLIRF